MGNFQYLAEKILAKNNPYSNKVSCFPPLAEETGNFQCKSGNNAGNFDRIYHEESQSISGLKEETHKETSRKPEPSNQETFAVKNHDKSFLINPGTVNMLDDFFSNATNLNIDLLSDDKRWLKTVCFGINRPILASFISEYIDRWHNAMEGKTVTYKKQNVGRRAANIWLRVTLTNQHIT